MRVVELSGVDLVTTLRTTIIVVGLLIGRISPAGQSPVSYAVLEGQPAGTFVGNLLRDANLTDGPRPTFSIRGRHRPSALPFSVDRQSGVVRTVGVLDREELCPPPDWSASGLPDPDSEAQCRVNFEVSVRTSLVLRLDVEILDLNDNAPTFPESEVIWVEIING